MLIILNLLFWWLSGSLCEIYRDASEFKTTYDTSASSPENLDRSLWASDWTLGPTVKESKTEVAGHHATKKIPNDHRVEAISNAELPLLAPEASTTNLDVCLNLDLNQPKRDSMKAYHDTTSSNILSEKRKIAEAKSSPSTPFCHSNEEQMIKARPVPSNGGSLHSDLDQGKVILSGRDVRQLKLNLGNRQYFLNTGKEKSVSSLRLASGPSNWAGKLKKIKFTNRNRKNKKLAMQNHNQLDHNHVTSDSNASKAEESEEYLQIESVEDLETSTKKRKNDDQQLDAYGNGQYNRGKDKVFPDLTSNNPQNHPESMRDTKINPTSATINGLGSAVVVTVDGLSNYMMDKNLLWFTDSERERASRYLSIYVCHGLLGREIMSRISVKPKKIEYDYPLRVRNYKENLKGHTIKSTVCMIEMLNESSEPPFYGHPDELQQVQENAVLFVENLWVKLEDEKNSQSIISFNDDVLFDSLPQQKQFKDAIFPKNMNIQRNVSVSNTIFLLWIKHNLPRVYQSAQCRSHSSIRWSNWVITCLCDKLLSLASIEELEKKVDYHQDNIVKSQFRDGLIMTKKVITPFKIRW